MITILGHKGFRYIIFLSIFHLLHCTNTFLKICSPELNELVELMKGHFRQLVVPVVESANRIDDVFNKRKLRNSENHISAATILHNIEKEYFLFRNAKIEQHTLGDLHPAIRQFTTFLYPSLFFF